MLIFNVIENGEIFTRDFRPLAKNNEIAFPKAIPMTPPGCLHFTTGRMNI